MWLVTQDFFNEIFNIIQRQVFLDEGIWKQIEEGQLNERYYSLPMDDYFTMCLSIAGKYKVSPKEVYETWDLPMVVVTFANLHNDNLTDYAQQLEAIDNKKPKRIDYTKEYIRNVTAEDLAEPVEEEPVNEVMEALKRQYGGF